MTESKHTPKPWVIEAEDPGGTAIIVGPRKGYPIARCFCYADMDGRFNAHLIAAAPDMLEALERSAVWVDYLADLDTFEDADQIDHFNAASAMIGAAIAKAKGEA